MRSKSSTTRASIASATVVAILLAACERGDSQPSSSAAQNAGPAAPAASAARSERWSYQDWPTGPYKVAENWPKPLPDTRHSHDGWTWGSFGGVYAESPDRIWIAMRGELPLPAGAAPWTPYAALTPSRGNSTGNGDGITATCGDEPKRGWERRFEHSIIVVNRAGELVDEWPELEKLFSAGPCGRGPHQIKISPYDPEKHVWIIDDQLHMIYRFTYDGKLEMSKGELGLRGRGPNTFDRPTDVAWLPDGTYFITDGYGGTRVAKYDKNDNFVKDWGGPPKDPQNPGPNEFNTVHSIAISKDQRLFVVDRGHQRMQVFDVDGNFLYHVPAALAALAGVARDARNQSLHRRQGLHLGRRRIHEPDLEIRPRRQLPLQLGRARPAARTLRVLARHHHRSARRLVHRGLLRGPRAEIRADPRDGPRQDRGPDLADLGHLEAVSEVARGRDGT